MFLPFHDDNPTDRTPVVTVALIAVNTVIFLWTFSLGPERQQAVSYRLGFVPQWLTQVSDPQPIEVPVGQQWVGNRRTGWVRVERTAVVRTTTRDVLVSLLSCMFLHGGWLHLIGNMWFLWLFGNNLEDRLGAIAFLAFYLVGGLAASGCHWLIDRQSPVPVVGASGAIAAVLGGYAVTWPWARVKTFVFLFVFFTIIELPALFVLGVWFLGQLLEGNRAMNLGVTGGVAWWAHVGGFVAGAAVMSVFNGLSGGARRHPALVPSHVDYAPRRLDEHAPGPRTMLP